MTVHTTTGEIVQISYDDVRRSIATTLTHLERAAEQVVWQIENKVWTVLGYGDWDEMREAEYRGAAVMVPRADRPELVARLRSEGLSQKQIGDTIGVTDRTVANDLNRKVSVEDQPATITNSRGQVRPTSYNREPEPEIVDAELVDDPEPMPQPTPRARARFEEDRALAVSQRNASKHIAESVWLLSAAAGHENAAEHYASWWQPVMDVYPKPTTAAQMRKAADFLNELAEVWHQ